MSDFKAYGRWVGPAVIVAVLTAVWARAFAGDGGVIPFHKEFFTQWYPYRLFLRASYACEFFPLWSHNLYAGFPLGAFPHAAQFYPLNLWFALAGYMSASTWFHLAHLNLAALFCYGLVRAWGASVKSAVVLALAYALSGPVFFFMGPAHDFVTVVWLPGVYWFGLRLMRGGRARDFCALAVVFALFVLAGDFEVVLYATAVFAAFVYMVEQPPARRVLPAALALIAGVLLAAPQALFTLEFLPHSFRHSNPVEGAELFRTNWIFLGALAGTMLPSAPGLEALWFMYLGLIIPLSLVLRSWKGDRAGRAMAIITAVVVVYYGNVWPFCLLTNRLPVLSGLAAPDVRYRALFPVWVLATMLAAPGLDSLLRSGPRPARRFIIASAVFLVFQLGWLGYTFSREGLTAHATDRVVLAVFLAAAPVFLLVKRKSMATLARWAFPAVVLALVLDQALPATLLLPVRGPEYLHSPLPMADTALSAGRRHFTSYLGQDRDLWRTVRLDRGPGYITGFIRNGLNRPLRLLLTMNRDNFNFFKVTMIAPANQPLLDFLAVDELVAKSIQPPSVSPFFLDNAFVASRYARNGRSQGTRPKGRNGRYSLPPGAEWETTVDLVPGDSLAMETAGEGAAELISVAVDDAVLTRPPTVKHDPARGLFTLEYALPARIRQTSRLAIAVSPEAAENVFVSDPRTVNRGRPYQLVERGELLRYENREALDKYRVYYDVKPVPDREALSALLDPDRFDPTRFMIMDPGEMDPGLELLPRSGPGPAVKVVEYRDQEVMLEAETRAPAYLSIAESYYPGWRAWVDGEEVRIRRANYAFAAVPLRRPGPHRILMRFMPWAFRVGLYAGLATLTALAAAGGLIGLNGPWTKGYNRAEGKSDEN